MFNCREWSSLFDHKARPICSLGWPLHGPHLSIWAPQGRGQVSLLRMRCHHSWCCKIAQRKIPRVQCPHRVSPSPLSWHFCIRFYVFNVFHKAVSSSLIGHWILRFKGVDESLEVIYFNSKKIKDLGFQFKYSLEDMFVQAVETCRAKGLLPPAAEKTLDGTN